MKIIAGRWGGRSLTRKPNPKMRPTSNKVREAIFSILDARFVNDWSSVRVLDLFAGTGAFGLEALSRGASRVSFVDNYLKAAQEIKQTLQKFEAEEGTSVVCKGALEAINWFERSDEKFDLIFLDPPYRQDWIVATLNRLQEKPIFSPKALVVAEYDKRESLSATEGFWTILNSRRFGDTVISFICPKVSEAYWKKEMAVENDEL